VRKLFLAATAATFALLVNAAEHSPALRTCGPEGGTDGGDGGGELSLG
jgi:hypothetical protein